MVTPSHHVPGGPSIGHTPPHHQHQSQHVASTLHRTPQLSSHATSVPTQTNRPLASAILPPSATAAAGGHGGMVAATPIGRSPSGGGMTQVSHGTTNTATTGTAGGGQLLLSPVVGSNNIGGAHISTPPSTPLCTPPSSMDGPTLAKHIRIDTTNIDSPSRLLPVTGSNNTNTAATGTGGGTSLPIPPTIHIISSHGVHGVGMPSSQTPSLVRNSSHGSLPSLPQTQYHHQSYGQGRNMAAATLNVPLSRTPSRSISPLPQQSQQQSLQQPQVLPLSSNIAALQLLRAVISTELLSDELILNEVLAQQHDHQLNKKQRSKPFHHQRFHINDNITSTTPTNTNTNIIGNTPTAVSGAGANVSIAGGGGVISSSSNESDDEIDQYLSFGSSYVIESG